MSSDLVQELVKSGGVAGVCLSLAYSYIRQLHKELKETQNKRVADQQAMVTKLLDLNDKWMETINSHVEVAEAQKNVLTELKQGVQSLQTYIQFERTDRRR